jgi:hypothetical protein
MSVCVSSSRENVLLLLQKMYFIEEFTFIYLVYVLFNDAVSSSEYIG